jgi:AhpC/TSA family
MQLWRMVALLACGMAAAAVATGPEVGQPVPDFRLMDQSGNERTLKSILGSKGALLVFYRSADW